MEDDVRLLAGGEGCLDAEGHLRVGVGNHLVLDRDVRLASLEVLEELLKLRALAGLVGTPVVPDDEVHRLGGLIGRRRDRVRAGSGNRRSRRRLSATARRNYDDRQEEDEARSRPCRIGLHFSSCPFVFGPSSAVVDQ
ncbi:MAG: hypothetical protein M5T61_09455 [Acidimicrobiia bacterium]|nr:hypothetical protein [Acidimicrobiia bacterium]